jgi:hypothetical protein
MSRSTLPVLPRRGWRRRTISDSHRADAAGISRTKCTIAVANQMTRRLVPRKGISHLSRDPLGGRMVRHADAHQSPSGVAKNDQAVEELEGDSAHHEQIERRDPSGVITQEGLPTLGGWSLPPSMYLATVDSATSIPRISSSLCIRGAPPQRILLVHPSDEIANLSVDPRTSTTPARLPAPISPKTAPMPPRSRSPA